MNGRKLSMAASIALIGVGVIALAGNMAATLFGLVGLRWGVWRLWPLTVVCSGLAFCVPPLVVRGKPGLGVLFIPGVPVLTTGSILMLASVFDAWGIWAWMWPLEIIGVALGLVMAGIYARALWLIVPAAMMGFVGLLLQFSAITGWWGMWGVMWHLRLLRQTAGIVGPAALILLGILILTGRAVRRSPAAS